MENQIMKKVAMRKLTLVIALLSIPTQVFAGSLYGYNSSTDIQANYRSVQSSTQAARLTDVFNGHDTIYTLENNYHEASYIRAQNEKLAIYQKLERARLAEREQQLREREHELQVLEQRMAFQMRDERKLQDLRSQTYAALPQSKEIAIGNKGNTEVRTNSSKGGPAGTWVRKVLFDWNN